jgi:hypothetical protein
VHISLSLSPVIFSGGGGRGEGDIHLNMQTSIDGWIVKAREEERESFTGKEVR